MGTLRKNGYIEIKPHWLKKHRILAKYLNACQTFDTKYHNFAYIDTHGGSGKVLLREKLADGSPLIAAKTQPSFPCHIIEINEESYARLEESKRDLPNIVLTKGDCNKEIGKILQGIEDWKFKFCFLDPDGLVYREGSQKLPQLCWKTVDQIAKEPKTEVLINIPLFQILRTAGAAEALDEEPTGEALEADVTQFYGTDEWKEAVNKRSSFERRKALLDTYIDSRLVDYEYVGSILIENEQGSPIYYLVYGSHHPVGDKIMYDVMKREWGLMLLYEQDTRRFYFHH